MSRAYKGLLTSLSPDVFTILNSSRIEYLQDVE